MLLQLKNFKVSLAFLSVLLLLVLAACGDSEGTAQGEENDQPAESNQSDNDEDATEDPAEEEVAGNDWPEKINMGVIPAEDQTSASDRVNEFAEELATHLGIEVDVFLGTDYNAVIEAMRTENIDIAFFGPFAYVLASERSGAEVFSIGGKSEEEIYYTSAIIVPKDSDAESIADLEGKDFLFVDPASTSGHIFPRAKVIEDLGVTNDEVESVFGSVTFSGSHDASILAIVNGDADGAAIATDVMDAMLDQGVINEGDFKIIASSDPIPRGPDAYRSNLPEDLKEAIREFYYSYENERFFEERGINGFYPVEDSAFDVVRRTAEALGMSPEELLN
ncbi:phosphate/phosphite/phosphonate ABC transporter substrate-binding protein [Evansella tamaricis]|uniref:Phosphate/phosphite/phosphonate ABC transporter substrate-binding protein n=1 Tax=Evansella tamaricis TaxID=2069301 RepID=A0ABS6JJB6_9BACI|nr:phosphate/phosphite/phosphonate ABC transporter substrate-binding protein [Evansella tamaricis]MBU9713681.1 phosphate/phosphite/phosphonate ABC transporter substrate-binding protein [Evansella tamaricis]